MAFLKAGSFWAIALLSVPFQVCNGYPSLLDGIHERQIDVGQLAAAYDYIVVGGGQSGLVIANRLSEDTGKTVLIVEYGYLDNTPSQVEPSSSFQYPTRDMFNVTTVAQPGINNARSSVYAASVVGGGSTINGMLFDRGSAEDYDNWAKLGNTGWDWAGLYPYFKKSTTFTAPPADLAAEYNITWDAAAYGNGPINATYPPWVWPTAKVQFAAWHDVGVATPKEAAAGMSYGSFWVPSNVDPVRIIRSYARNGYWDPAASRTNLKLLTGYRVNEVQFDANKRAQSVTIQQRGTANGAATITVKANQEIILCAGWLHTPHILQRSGVGPQSLLTSAGVNVLVDLPGVGTNLQDHPAGSVSFTYQKDLIPNQSTARTNATFAAWAQQQWLQRKGPQSVGVGNSLATIPLAIFHPGYQTTIAKAQAQNAATYLPNTYTAENIAGYQAQRDILLKSMASLTNAHIEIPFSGGASNSLCLEKPLSRGTIRMSTSDKYAEPSVDYNTNINPVDSDVFVAAVKFYRKWMAAPSMAQLSPVEQSPGTSVTSDAALASFAASGMGSSTAHSCCTSPMMPRAMGGVIGPDLLVYGVTGLSVGDISMIPLIPATHTCATVYAIAEKAADIIKARASSNPNPGSSSSSTVGGSSTSTLSSSMTSVTKSSTTTSVPPATTTTGTPPATQTHWGQCGGQDWKGATTCESPYTCKYSNAYYSQCL